VVGVPGLGEATRCPSLRLRSGEKDHAVALHEADLPQVERYFDPPVVEQLVQGLGQGLPLRPDRQTSEALTQQVGGDRVARLVIGGFFRLHRLSMPSPKAGNITRAPLRSASRREDGVLTLVGSTATDWKSETTSGEI
jgi:hypothetical protein